MTRGVKTALALAVVAAVIAAGIALWAIAGAWPQGDVQAKGNTDPASAPQETRSASSPYALSAWVDFETYWEETEDGSYAETNADGVVRRYALRDGFDAGDGVDSSALLYGANRVYLGDIDTEWDLAAVDCSTGEVTFWLSSKWLSERLGADDVDYDILRLQGILPYDGRKDTWVIYVNMPILSGESEYGASNGLSNRSIEDFIVDQAGDFCCAYEGIVALFEGSADALEDKEVLLSYFGADDSYSSLKALIANRADKETRKELVAKYGDTEVEKWESTAVLSEHDAFIEFMSLSFGEDYTTENSEIIDAVLNKRGWDQ